MKHIAYIRVSTEEQGRTGLGLQAQRKAIQSYVNKTGGEILAEYQDIESGSKVDREGLNQAIRHALQSGASILVKKLDRLSRDGFKIVTQLKELGIPYLDVESPHDPTLIKNIKMALAMDEREKISERTRSALESIQDTLQEKGHYITKEGRRITSLGNPDTLGGALAIERSIATRRRKAANHPANQQATAIIRMMHNEGKTFSEITKFLNDNGFKTSRGNDFSQTQVTKLFKRDKDTTYGNLLGSGQQSRAIC